MKGASMLSGGRRCACECPMVFRPQLAYRSANRSPLLSCPMHTPDQIGTSALPRSLRAPGIVRRRFGRFELDEVKACLLRDGKIVALPPTPFAVLCALVRQPGMLLTKNALLDEVWGHQFVSDSVLKTVISELRILLDDDARRPRFIETLSR